MGTSISILSHVTREMWLTLHGGCFRSCLGQSAPFLDDLCSSERRFFGVSCLVSVWLSCQDSVLSHVFSRISLTLGACCTLFLIVARKWKESEDFERLSSSKIQDPALSVADR